jgi:small subunit ribosomal protein S2
MLKQRKILTEKHILKLLIKYDIHLGQNKKNLNSNIKFLIHSKRNDKLIFNREKTILLLRKILRLLVQISLKNGQIIYISTNFHVTQALEKICIDKNEYVVKKYAKGLLTNFSQTLKHINNFKKISIIKTKSNRNLRQTIRFNLLYLNLIKVKQIPNLIIIFDLMNDKMIIQEAKQLNIPLIGILDSNNNPNLRDFIIPANNKNLRSILLFAHLFHKSFIIGKKLAQKHKIINNKNSITKTRKYSNSIFIQKIYKINEKWFNIQN